MCEGLSTLGVLDCIRENPDTWKYAFTAPEKPTKLQPSDIIKTFEVDWSSKDTTERNIEERIHGYWLDFVQEVYGIDFRSI